MARLRRENAHDNKPTPLSSIDPRKQRAALVRAQRLHLLNVAFRDRLGLRVSFLLPIALRLRRDVLLGLSFLLSCSHFMGRMGLMRFMGPAFCQKLMIPIIPLPPISNAIDVRVSVATSRCLTATLWRAFLGESRCSECEITPFEKRCPEGSRVNRRISSSRRPPARQSAADASREATREAELP